jgi:ABC-type multidrug transport system ATPase subunit
LDGKIDEYNNYLCITLDNVEITKPDQKQDFKYVPHPNELPDDITVESFIRFNARLLKLSGEEKTNYYAAVFPAIETIKGKTFGQLDNDERGRVMLSVLPYYKNRIFLVNNIAVGMSDHFILELNDVMRSWAMEGAAVLYLTSDSKINIDRLRAEIRQDFTELEGWSSVVSNYKKMLNEEQTTIGRE